MSHTTYENAPIGIFDSGIGGLSVLRHIRDILPHEDLIYVADSAYAPYGDKPEKNVVSRIEAIASFLFHDHHCKALVVACNTGTAAAIHLLRDHYPQIPIVGVEPGLKPATLATKSRVIGVLATDRTISSNKFQTLRNQLAQTTGVTFLEQPCYGLALQIESGDLDGPNTKTLVRQYVAPLIEQNADTLVLGCTHYPFVQEQIVVTAKEAGATSLFVIDTGEPVARQLARLLEQHQLLHMNNSTGELRAYTTGESASLETAFHKLLNLYPQVERIAI